MHYERTTLPIRLYRTNRADLPPVRWLEQLADRLGPARAHRFGHGDHDHGESATDAEADVLAAIRERAGDIHETLSHDHGVFAVEFVGSTGGGKTKLIEELVERAPADDRIGAIVGDVAGEDDATRLREYGIAVENVNTGKECHLDPGGIETALDAFDLEKLDTLYVENVGNMVCPADFPLGATVRVLVVSTTEGDDVVAKHPLLVQKCDAAVVNKVDLAEAVGTDLDRVRADLGRVAPEVPVFETDAKSGAGVDELAEFLESKRTKHDCGHDHGHDHGEHEYGHEHGHDDEHDRVPHSSE